MVNIGDKALLQRWDQRTFNIVIIYTTLATFQGRRQHVSDAAGLTFKPWSAMRGIRSSFESTSPSQQGINAIPDILHGKSENE
jgi:hypothetical protein